MAAFDDRLRSVEWRVTAGVTSTLPVYFTDDTGDPLPVDGWSFAAQYMTRPAGPATALSVDVSQAAAGLVVVTVDDAVSASLASGVWSLVWTVLGEPEAGVGGRFLVEPRGARGVAGPGFTGVSVEVVP